MSPCWRCNYLRREHDRLCPQCGAGRTPPALAGLPKAPVPHRCGGCRVPVPAKPDGRCRACGVTDWQPEAD